MQYLRSLKKTCFSIKKTNRGLALNQNNEATFEAEGICKNDVSKKKPGFDLTEKTTKGKDPNMHLWTTIPWNCTKGFLYPETANSRYRSNMALHEEKILIKNYIINTLEANIKKKG